MLLGLLGDLHGDFAALERAMAADPAAAAWLSVGDIASEAGAYPAPSRPFFFIKGNNEDFDMVARLAAGERVATNLHLIPNGKVVLVEGVRVGGLGGTFAPKWYGKAPEDLPASARRQTRASHGVASPDHAARDLSRRSAAGTKADDKRRHFVRAEVDACLALKGVDLFLTHEAPRPYWVGAGRRRNDAGKTVVNEILAALRPRLHVFGHHHKHSERTVDGVPSIGLPLVADGYLLLETAEWSWTFRRFGDLPISLPRCAAAKRAV
jgi:hypothetical protein